VAGHEHLLEIGPAAGGESPVRTAYAEDEREAAESTIIDPGQAGEVRSAQVLNTLSWCVCRPKAIGKSVKPSMVVATFTGAPGAAPVAGST
jgi:hypothetical protein